MGESILELFEKAGLEPEGCFKHIALQCESVDESYNKALLAGAAVYVEPRDICLDFKEKHKLRIAFVTGINGEQVELCENR